MSKIEIAKEWDMSYNILDIIPNVVKAHDILKRHNEWRLGAEIEPINPKDLTIAINVALTVMEDNTHLAEMEHIPF